jgi:maltooligosyltrehalose trehalohydrolase
VRRGRLALVCNLAAERQAVPLPASPATVLLASEHGFVFTPEGVQTDGESAVVVELA